MASKNKPWYYQQHRLLFFLAERAQRIQKQLRGATTSQQQVQPSQLPWQPPYAMTGGVALSPSSLGTPGVVATPRQGSWWHSLWHVRFCSPYPEVEAAVWSLWMGWEVRGVFLFVSICTCVCAFICINTSMHMCTHRYMHTHT